MNIQSIVQIVAACFGSLGFAILFNIHGKQLLFASFAGLVDWWVYVMAGLWCTSNGMRYFWAALALGLYSEIMARRQKVPTTLYIVVGFIPLIPGSSLFLTMNFVFARDWSQVLHYGAMSINTAAGIVVGIISSMAVTQLVCRIKGRCKYVSK